MSDARAMWRLYEPIHVTTYFAPEARQAFTDAGLRGFWRGYFAGRCAPLGPVSAAPVLASFFSFAPAIVTRAVPAVWELIEPERALTARVDGAVAALTVLFDGISPSDVVAAAELLEHAVTTIEPAGRVLGAANAALPRYDQPLARLWQAATTLREHRGDGHIAALVTADLGPCEVLVLRCGIDLSRDVMQPTRGWTDDEWTTAARRLVERGLLDESGTATREGLDLFAAAEAATDVAASAPVRALGSAGLAQLTELMHPMAQACATVLPEPNPIGLRP